RPARDILTLHLCIERVRAIPLEDLRERRNLLAQFVARAVAPRVTLVEPRAAVNLLKHRGGVVVHFAVDADRSLERGVVEDEGDAVAREAHIELDAVSAILEGSLKGGVCVLGRVRRGAAVADDERAAVGSSPFGCSGA